MTTRKTAEQRGCPDCGRQDFDSLGAWITHRKEHEVGAPITRGQTPGAFYSQGKQVFIGHVAIAEGLDAAWALRIADALNYRKRSI